MTNPKDFRDSCQIMRIQMMLCPAVLLTHCSYHKLKIIVLFHQLYNHPYSGLNNQFPFSYTICVSIKLQFIPFSPYSAVYRFIQFSNPLLQVPHITIFQHFHSKANSTVILLSAKAKIKHTI